MAAHTPISDVLRREAAATDSEIPVPSATYAAKQAGHFGSRASTSAGSDHRANFTERQQAGLFIGDSHSRSRMQLLSVPQRLSPQDNGHDGGPMTS
jgi:hypothetical protein